MLVDPRLDWLKNEDIQPYVYVREDNRISQPGSHSPLNWFEGKKPVFINPLWMKEVEFGNQILALEGQAFGPTNLAMPRWVFYDCAITPGFVAGFAIRNSAIPAELRSHFGYADGKHEWTPLSLFIIIPTMSPDEEWCAHNLCTVNSFLPKDKQFYGLGFLSKAFGLWYANVNILVGFTQWANAAMKLHSYYGPFEILTAYTPIHSYSRTLTYRVKLESSQWGNFLSKKPMDDFDSRFKASGLKVHPKDDSSLRDIQSRLERKEGPYFLNPHEVLTKNLGEPLSLYQPT